MAGDRKKPPPPANVSGEDLRLWRHVTKDAKPLAGRTPSRPEDDRENVSEAAPVARGPARPQPARRAPREAPLQPELVAGALADVDKRTAERLRRGKLEIEGRLDLHGMTLEEAGGEVGAFLAEAQATGKRCVLVITGKGEGREGGVLRRTLPQLLNLPANRARLVAFVPAQPRHGGQGAFYLHLRRRRRDD